MSLRWIALLAALVLLLVLSVSVGALHVPVVDAWRGLAGSGDPTVIAVVRSLRLPRAVVAMLVGAALGMSGGALQGTMRNPLAEPYLLGVSGGAAVGAVLAVTSGLPQPLVPLAGFAGAVVTIGIAFAVAHAARGRGDPRVLLMAGVVVGAFANAAIMLVLANAPASTVRGALWWMMGSVADASWTQAAALAAYATVGAVLLLAWARDIDALALGEDTAAGLGLDVERSARRIYLVAALLAAATVAAAGLVGFVGLVVPHLARRIAPGRHRALLVACALVGAVLVVAADLIARVARSPAELPLGAVTALIGVPFFLARLRKLS
ncbi:MAG: ABC-type transporter, integral rane subunit [Gemmatimonadetes bacterium]|nr:ABC-type transporter, integral rane subunit [Gemmatimonadota bacterium]